MKKLGAVVGVLCLVATLTACVTTESATNHCLARPVVNIADDSAKYPLGWRIIPDGSAIDARSGGLRLKTMTSLRPGRSQGPGT